jgi:hypothetical protein
MKKEFKLGDYVTIQHSSNFKTIYIAISCTPSDTWGRDIAGFVYAAECELQYHKRDQYGNPIWEVRKCLYWQESYSCCNFRLEKMSLSTDEEITEMKNALLIRGVIWNSKTMSFDDRPLPDLSKGLLLNKDSAYCWHKVLKPYIGKVYFSEREDSQTNVYESPWHTIWNMILKEKLRREEKTHKVSFEMEEHMFEVLRTLYQAPLIKVSYPFHNEKQAKKAFIVAEKTNRYDDERGFVMGEPKLHLVTNMVHLTSAVCRYDLYKMITDKDSIHSDGLKVYLPNEK